jgi:hypothetical protein
MKRRVCGLVIIHFIVRSGHTRYNLQSLRGASVIQGCGAMDAKTQREIGAKSRDPLIDFHYQAAILIIKYNLNNIISRNKIAVSAREQLENLFR